MWTLDKSLFPRYQKNTTMFIWSLCSLAVQFMIVYGPGQQADHLPEGHQEGGQGRHSGKGRNIKNKSAKTCGPGGGRSLVHLKSCLPL